MRLLVTRPEPDASALARALAELGHEAELSPLFETEFVATAPLPIEGVQAVIATSRNAVRAMQRDKNFETLKKLPLFAVGTATAQLAEEFGFENIHVGEGTAEKLAPVIASSCNKEDGALLHPAGEKLAWDLKGALEVNGFTVLQPVVYRSLEIVRLPESTILAIRNGTLDGVILMSPETAKHFIKLVGDEGLEKEAGKLAYFCLSGSVVKRLEALTGIRVQVANRPTQDDVLALIG